MALLAQHGIVYPIEVAVVVGSTVEMASNFAPIVATPEHPSFFPTVVAVRTVTSSYFLLYVSQFISLGVDEDFWSPEGAQQMGVCFIKWTIEGTIGLQKLSIGAALVAEGTVNGYFAGVGYV